MTPEPLSTINKRAAALPTRMSALDNSETPSGAWSHWPAPGRERHRELQCRPEEIMPSSDAEYWNGRFANDSYIFGTRPAAFVADNAHYIPPHSRVLVPADGEGRNSVFLAELGHRVLATDIADKGLA